ncbi:MAG: alkyldihydroxyacetonephosphate synthase [Actinomycetota bacterium]|jgi:alkyldihydroxyacetonephosphate synthase|nr:alkyldihydroxyacetonephosphate synthase [Actinomycetota bacterium]
MTYAVWGWGAPRDEPTTATLAQLAPFVAATTGVPVQDPFVPRPLADLPAARIDVPPTLAGLASAADADRARHGIGRSYRDLIRAVRGELTDVPGVVLRPRTEQDVVDVVDWAGSTGVPLVPYGGGTSVVGGVEPVGLDRAVSLDLQHLAGVVEVDPVSRAVRVRAGTLGPALEDALRPHGLTLRFYPQSFERSSVGGWLATRAAGHFSTGATHIDDLVESIRAVTPTGLWESRRLPASGAGPSPDRMLLGSEGSLGVITEAWLRAQPRPAHRWSATLAAPDFAVGAEAVRMLMHSGSSPATCRLIDPAESALTGTLATGEAALVLGFESLAAPVDSDAAAALDVCQGAGLRVVESGVRGSSGEAWRSAFVRAPYLREQLVLLGVLVETFESAVTWDRLPGLVSQVTASVTDALVTICGGGRVTCRLTHVYPDGAAPYFTVFAPSRRGAEVAQWDEVKAAAGEALLAAGGTITHHHAVGRDHRPWYDRQRPDPFARALAAAKRELDPSGVLNPGVLFGGASRA